MGPHMGRGATVIEIQGHGFESHPSFSVPLCDPIFLPVANAQMGKLGNFSVLQLTLKNYSLYLV